MTIADSASSQELRRILESSDRSVYDVTTKADGPAGSLPLTDAMLKDWPSGDLFGLTQNAGMGWTAAEVARDPYLILSTQGGLRAADGQPIALGYHTGHWEIGLLVEEAAAELRRCDVVPFAGMVSDPCDGRTQGTAGMMDSLPYRNDAAIVFRRLIRSLPRRKGVLGRRHLRQGTAGHDDGPGGLEGSARRPGARRRDPAAHARAKTPARSSRSAPATPTASSTLHEAAELGCRACASPGGGCQFLGTAATSQVVAEALGMTLPHAALARRGSRSGATWPAARRAPSSRWRTRGITLGHVLTEAAIRNAMVVHAAFGGSTNLLLHIPAIAFAAGLPRPTVDDWHAVNLKVPRLVSVLPNGPVDHPTVRVFLAGGVPEVMLHLRELGLLDETVLTVTGEPLGRVLDWWENERAPQAAARAAAASKTASIPTT